MLIIDRFSHYRELEAILQNELQKYELIGELPIDRENYENLLIVMQRASPIENYNQWGKWKISNVPKVVFVTSMVFCARYTDENIRNFWTPYARLWGLEHAEQRFQSQCRDYFRETRQWLKSTYNFYFPTLDHEQWDEGQVVKDVYTHAVIPFHLQDNFARWLLKQDMYRYKRFSLKEIVDELLHRDELFKYISSNLKHFMQSPATVEIAANLIKTLAEAYQLHEQGLSDDQIEDLLKNVERDIWKQFTHEFEQVTRAQATYKRDVTARWVWSIEEDELQLLVTQATFKSAQAPDKWVFMSQDKDRTTLIVNTFVDPWEIGENRWLIEETFIKDLPNTSGELTLVDTPGSPIAQINVSPFEINSVNAFQLTRQNSLGIPVQLHQSYLTSGEWLISMRPDVAIKSGSDHEDLLPRMEVVIPQKLYDHGHRKAGIYQLTLPANFLTPDGIISVDSLMTPVERVSLYGDGIDELSKRVPPVYISNRINLHLENINLRLKQKYSLWIKSAQGDTKRYSYVELIRKQILEEEEDRAVINLRFLIPNEPGIYEVEVRKNLQIISADTISVLPNVQIKSPNLTEVYTPKNPPFVELLGVAAENIRTSTGQVISGQTKVRVEWPNLRDDCRLALQLNNARIPLAWDINRFYSWTDPDNENEFFRTEELKQMGIHIRGPRSARFSLRVNDGQPRDYELNKAGEYNNELYRDQLFEMITHQNAASAVVFLTYNGDEWEIFRILRHPEIRNITTFYDNDNRELNVEFLTNHDWTGTFKLELKPVPGLSESNKVHNLLFSEFSPGESLILPCDLDTGLYDFNLTLDDKAVPVPKQIQLEVTDQLWQDADLELEDTRFNARSTQTIRVTGQEKVRLVQLSRQRDLTEDDISELATFPAKHLIKLNAQADLPIWGILDSLRELYTQKKQIEASSGLHTIPLSIIRGTSSNDYLILLPVVLPGLEAYDRALEEWQGYISQQRSIYQKLHDLFIDNYEQILATVSQHNYPLARAIYCLCETDTSLDLSENYPLENFLVACQLRSIAQGFRQRYLTPKITDALLSLSHEHTPLILKWSLLWAEALLRITRRSEFKYRK